MKICYGSGRSAYTGPAIEYNGETSSSTNGLVDEDINSSYLLETSPLDVDIGEPPLVTTPDNSHHLLETSFDTGEPLMFLYDCETTGGRSHY